MNYIKILIYFILLIIIRIIFSSIVDYISIAFGSSNDILINIFNIKLTHRTIINALISTIVAIIAALLYKYTSAIIAKKLR